MSERCRGSWGGGPASPPPPRVPPRPTFLAVPAVEAPRALARVGVIVGITGASVEAGV